MQAVGIVVEYNPFHNGHVYHARQAKTITNADIVIAVMSGHFLQRGEPALVDKWHRTQMALANGVDIVIELPYVYSTAHAKDFAKGAIFLLDAIGCQSVVFGSEHGEITPFHNTYELIHSHYDQYNSLIKEFLQTGISYPKALFQAYEQLQQNKQHSYVDLSKPNNILGFHYIEAAHTIQSTIQPYTFARIEAGYHDEIDKEKHIASATGIRKALFEQNDLTYTQPYMPATTYDILAAWYKSYNTFASWELFWPLLQFTIVRCSPQQLAQFAEVTEGIEFALIKAAKTSDTFQQFMSKIKSKRFTWTRLQRMLTHIFTGFTKEQASLFSTPTAIRLLGMTKEGQDYLSTHKKDFILPLISRVGSTDDEMLKIDIHATDIYALGIALQNNSNKIQKDYQTPPIRVT